MLAHGLELFCKVVTQSAFGFSNVEQATLGPVNTIHKIGRGTGEMLLHLDSLFRPLDGEQGGGERAGVVPSAVTWEGAKGTGMVLVVKEWTVVSQRKQSLQNADSGSSSMKWQQTGVDISTKELWEGASV
eukprot:g26739.t1